MIVDSKDIGRMYLFDSVPPNIFTALCPHLTDQFIGSFSLGYYGVHVMEMTEPAGLSEAAKTFTRRYLYSKALQQMALEAIS